MNIDATFWVAVSFFIFAGGLVYLKIPQKINEVLSNKIKETKNELEEAEKLKDEAKTLLSNYENKLAQSLDETKDIVDKAKKDGEKNLIDSTENITRQDFKIADTIIRRKKLVIVFFSFFSKFCQA